jgi:hypothetical protein
MMKSHVIEVDGVFVGAAIQHPAGYKLVAVAPQLTSLNGMVYPTLEDTRRALRSSVKQGAPLEKPGSATPDRI